MERRSVSALLAAALVLGGVVLTPARAFASSAESRFTSLLNHERTSRGGRSLVTKSDLVSVARRHSQEMASRGSIYHNQDLPNEVRGWRVLGENVGRGGSVDSIHNAFMDSAPHRANILDRRFNHVGVGTAVNGDYIYVTEVFAARGSTTSAAVRHRPAPRVVRRPLRPRATPVRRRASVASDPQTVEILVRLIGLDARQVDPATGAAKGI